MTQPCRVVYVCKCGLESSHESCLKTDWTCRGCKKIERTVNQLPEEWEAWNGRNGEMFVLCPDCLAKLGSL